MKNTIPSPTRKRKKETRDIALSAWFTPSEWEDKVKPMVEQSGVKQSEYFRGMVLHGTVHTKAKPEVLEQLRDTVQTWLEYRTHFARIGNLIKAGKMDVSADETKALIERINNLLNQLK